MERCTYKKGNKMDFLRPDGKEIEINSKEEAADHIRKSCNDCKKYDRLCKRKFGYQSHV